MGTYERELGEKDAALERRLLGPLDEGLPLEEVGLRGAAPRGRGGQVEGTGGNGRATLGREGRGPSRWGEGLTSDVGPGEETTIGSRRRRARERSTGQPQLPASPSPKPSEPPPPAPARADGPSAPLALGLEGTDLL